MLKGSIVMKNYNEEKLFLMNNPIWVKSIKMLKKFKNDDNDARFHLKYKKMTERKDKFLEFTSIKHFVNNEKDYFIFMPVNITLLDIEIKEFDGEDYRPCCFR